MRQLSVFATARGAASQRSRRLSLGPRSLVSWPGVTLPLAVLVAGGLVGAWLATRSPASASPPYIYAPVTTTTMRQTLSSSGTISPATTSTLSFGASGQVTAVDATVGEKVTLGETLATMYSATLKAQVAQAEATLAGDQARLSQDEASVAASVIDRIKTGDQVVISSEGATAAGTVASIGLIANTSSGVATFPLVIDVTGTPSGLYSGASATVSIIYNQLTDVLAVPTAAVQISATGKDVVYAVVNGRQVARDVKTGIVNGGLTQITSGLTAGERVVVDIPRIVVPAGPGNLHGPFGKRNVFFSGPGGAGRVIIQGGG